MLRKIIITLGVFLALGWGLSSAQATTWQELLEDYQRCNVTPDAGNFTEEELADCHETLRGMLYVYDLSLKKANANLNQCRASQTQTSGTTYRSPTTTQPLQIYSSPSGGSTGGGTFMPGPQPW